VVVSRPTTPPAPDDVPALFRGIERHAATATRLHPRRAAPTWLPDPRGSHLGAAMRWPADEPWPVCEAAHVVATETPVPPAVVDRLRAATPANDFAGWTAAMAELASDIPGFVGVNRRTGTALGHTKQQPAAPCPLVPVVQLRAADVPDLAPPDGDLLQVLWCPHDHDLDGEPWAPAITVRWRWESGVPDICAPPPAPATANATYLPAPCVLYPERVVEYPWWQDLPAELGHHVGAWDARHGGRYHRQLATAPGWKVGGWAPWPTTDPVPMYCANCGAPMRHLLQVDSGEWGDPQRWRPVGSDHADAEPTGVVVGRSGLLRIFHCPFCPDAPVRVDLQ
jgi:hypothetical protein